MHAGGLNLSEIARQPGVAAVHTVALISFLFLFLLFFFSFSAVGVIRHVSDETGSALCWIALRLHRTLLPLRTNAHTTPDSVCDLPRIFLTGKLYLEA